MDNLVLYISCTTLGGAGAWLISRWGKVLGYLDSPNDRSSHEGVVPKGGGIGILAAFLFVCMFTGIPFVFWVPINIISLFGLYGDGTDLPPKVRLFSQLSAAIIIILGTKNPLSHYWLLIMAPLWAVFIVGTANFYNFMDGINGIAGITGVVGFGLLALSNFLSQGEPSFTVLSLCISLSCLGFLPFNMPKAKVFMGDVGIHRLRRFHGSKIR